MSNNLFTPSNAFFNTKSGSGGSSGSGKVGDKRRLSHHERPHNPRKMKKRKIGERSDEIIPPEFNFQADRKERKFTPPGDERRTTPPRRQNRRDYGRFDGNYVNNDNERKFRVLDENRFSPPRPNERNDPVRTVSVIRNSSRDCSHTRDRSYRPRSRSITPESDEEENKKNDYRPTQSVLPDSIHPNLNYLIHGNGNTNEFQPTYDHSRIGLPRNVSNSIQVQPPPPFHGVPNQFSNPIVPEVNIAQSSSLYTPPIVFDRHNNNNVNNTMNNNNANQVKKFSPMQNAPKFPQKRIYTTSHPKKVNVVPVPVKQVKFSESFTTDPKNYIQPNEPIQPETTPPNRNNSVNLSEAVNRLSDLIIEEITAHILEVMSLTEKRVADQHPERINYDGIEQRVNDRIKQVHSNERMDHPYRFEMPVVGFPLEKTFRPSQRSGGGLNILTKRSDVPHIQRKYLNIAVFQCIKRGRIINMKFIKNETDAESIKKNEYILPKPIYNDIDKNDNINSFSKSDNNQRGEGYDEDEDDDDGDFAKTPSPSDRDYAKTPSPPPPIMETPSFDGDDFGEDGIMMTNSNEDNRTPNNRKRSQQRNRHYDHAARLKQLHVIWNSYEDDLNFQGIPLPTKVLLPMNIKKWRQKTTQPNKSGQVPIGREESHQNKRRSKQFRLSNYTKVETHFVVKSTSTSYLKRTFSVQPNQLESVIRNLRCLRQFVQWASRSISGLVSIRALDFPKHDEKEITGKEDCSISIIYPNHMDPQNDHKNGIFWCGLWEFLEKKDEIFDRYGSKEEESFKKSKIILSIFQRFLSLVHQINVQSMWNCLNFSIHDGLIRFQKKKGVSSNSDDEVEVQCFAVLSDLSCEGDINVFGGTMMEWMRHFFPSNNRVSRTNTNDPFSDEEVFPDHKKEICKVLGLFEKSHSSCHDQKLRYHHLFERIGRILGCCIQELGQKKEWK